MYYLHPNQDSEYFHHPQKVHAYPIPVNPTPGLHHSHLCHQRLAEPILNIRLTGIILCIFSVFLLLLNVNQTHPNCFSSLFFCFCIFLISRVILLIQFSKPSHITTNLPLKILSIQCISCMLLCMQLPPLTLLGKA